MEITARQDKLTSLIKGERESTDSLSFYLKKQLKRIDNLQRICYLKIGNPEDSIFGAYASHNYIVMRGVFNFRGEKSLLF